MLYILRTAIPEKRILKKGLISIYGLGKSSAHLFFKSFGFSKDARGKDVRLRHRSLIKYTFEEYPRILTSELSKFRKNTVERLISTNCYRGRRHKAGLPVRGQRTHTNAKTKKPSYDFSKNINTYKNSNFLKKQKKR